MHNMVIGKKEPETCILRVNNVQATNFRRFRQLNSTFHTQLTVLVAPNTVGKTACLDAIAGVLGAFTNQLSTSPGRHYAHTDVRRALHHERSGEMEIAHAGLTVTADVLLSRHEGAEPVAVESPLAQSAEFALQNIMGTHAAPQTGSTIKRIAALKTQLELAVRSGNESEAVLAELNSLGYHVRSADMALWRTLAAYNEQPNGPAHA